MSDTLKDKSLTQLRGLAQHYGVKDIFQLDALHLRQAIEAKQVEMMPAPRIEISKPEYDARLMTKPPNKKADEELAMEMLAPYIARGLNVRFTEEQWFMSFGKKNDQGTIRMPIRTLLLCADKVMA